MSTENLSKKIFTFEEIKKIMKPIAEKYQVEKIYLFGSYARGEADENSDLDFLVYGGENFKLTLILTLAENLREIFNKKIDAFEIREVNIDSNFYDAIMREKVLVA